MTPERAATAPAIPVWRDRLVAGAAELGGSVADRGAGNTAVRCAAISARRDRLVAGAAGSSAVASPTGVLATPR